MEGEKARHEHHSHAGTDAQTREVGGSLGESGCCGYCYAI